MSDEHLMQEGGVHESTDDSEIGPVVVSWEREWTSFDGGPRLAMRVHVHEIGAVGEHFDEAVLTRNETHFDRLGVDVEPY